MKKTVYITLFSLLFFSFSLDKKIEIKAVPILSDPVSGVLTTTNTVRIIDHQISPYYNFSFAVFRNVSGNLSTPSFVDVDSVKINDILLGRREQMYMDTTFKLQTPPINWNINSSGLIPSFSYINTNLIPEYSGFNNIPDNIYQNQDFTVLIDGFSHVDEIFVNIRNLVTGQAVEKKLLGVGSVNFLAQELAPLFSGDSTLTFSLLLSNSKQETINNKQFVFLNQLLIQKDVTITN